MTIINRLPDRYRAVPPLYWPLQAPIWPDRTPSGDDDAEARALLLAADEPTRLWYSILCNRLGVPLTDESEPSHPTLAADPFHKPGPPCAASECRDLQVDDRTAHMDDTTITKPLDDPKARACAKALATATERLWEAIIEGSPETGQTLLQTLDLAGCTFSTTVRRIEPTRFMVDVGVIDPETARGLNVYSLELVRTDASPLPFLQGIAAGA